MTPVIVTLHTSYKKIKYFSRYQLKVKSRSAIVRQVQMGDKNIMPTDDTLSILFPTNILTISCLVEYVSSSLSQLSSFVNDCLLHTSYTECTNKTGHTLRAKEHLINWALYTVEKQNMLYIMCKNWKCHTLCDKPKCICTLRDQTKQNVYCAAT